MSMTRGNFRKHATQIFFAGLLSLFAAQEASAAGGFEIEQQVRNLTQRQFFWTDSVEAKPGDRVEFLITVTWNGAQPTKDVLVRETLHEALNYEGSLKLDGGPIEGDVVGTNLNIGNFDPDQYKTVALEATVARPVSSGSLVNTATVFNAEAAASTSTNVQALLESGPAVRTPPTPTDVSTGAFTLWGAALLLLFAFAFVGSYIFLFKYYYTNNILHSGFETRVERKLALLVSQTKRNEEAK